MQLILKFGAAANLHFYACKHQKKVNRPRKETTRKLGQPRGGVSNSKAHTNIRIQWLKEATCCVKNKKPHELNKYKRDNKVVAKKKKQKKENTNELAKT